MEKFRYQIYKDKPLSGLSCCNTAGAMFSWIYGAFSFVGCSNKSSRSAGAFIILTIATLTTPESTFAKSLVHSPSTPPCQDDPYKIKDEKYVRLASNALGLDLNNIAFIGCLNGKFSSTEGVSKPSGERTYTIRYPIYEEIAAPHEGYIAPITHELSHIYQFKRSGSMAAAIKECRLKLELGADVLAGFLFKTALDEGNINLFNHNLKLIGDFDPSIRDAHGRPHDRSIAFRFGYYAPTTIQATEIEDVYQYAKNIVLTSRLNDFKGAVEKCD